MRKKTSHKRHAKHHKTTRHHRKPLLHKEVKSLILITVFAALVITLGFFALRLYREEVIGFAYYFGEEVHLADLPFPFVEEGYYNTIIVVDDAAPALDVVAAQEVELYLTQFVTEPIDNCPTVPNVEQGDSDGDGQGDACDCTPDDGLCTAELYCLEQGKVDTDCGIPECIETDAGDDKNNFGTAKGASLYIQTEYVEVVDYCSSTWHGPLLPTTEPTNYIVESVCTADGYVRHLVRYCPSGCVNGECQEPYIPLEGCTDTDDGIEFDAKGETTGVKESFPVQTWTDKCNDDITLTEYYCDEFVEEGVGILKVFHFIHDCPDGCTDGHCIAPCFDSDGLDYQTKGYVIINGLKEYDHCRDDDLLVEPECVTEDRAERRTVSCSTQFGINYGCFEGRCALKEPGCYADADCGTKELGAFICVGEEVHQEYTDWTCLNPGQPIAECRQTSGTELIKNCLSLGGECWEGICLPAPRTQNKALQASCEGASAIEFTGRDPDWGNFVELGPFGYHSCDRTTNNCTATTYTDVKNYTYPESARTMCLAALDEDYMTAWITWKNLDPTQTGVWGNWMQVNFQEPTEVNFLVIRQRYNAVFLGATLTFDNGDQIYITDFEMENVFVGGSWMPLATKRVAFPTKTVNWVKLEYDVPTPYNYVCGLTEFELYKIVDEPYGLIGGTGMAIASLAPITGQVIEEYLDVDNDGVYTRTLAQLKSDVPTLSKLQEQNVVGIGVGNDNILDIYIMPYAPQPGQGMIALVQNGDYLGLVITGYDNADVLRAARLLADGYVFEPGYDIAIIEEIDNQTVVTYPEKVIDLEITGLTFVPETPIVGDNVAVIADLGAQNIPDGTQFELEIGAYDSLGNFVDGCGAMVTYSGGEFLNHDCSVDDFPEPGIYTIIATIDTADVVEETDETNNEFTTTLEVFKYIPCIDSDGGNKIYTKGYTRGLLTSGEYIEFEDYCRVGIDGVTMGVEEGQCGIYDGVVFIEVGLAEGTHVVAGPNWFECSYGCKYGFCLTEAQQCDVLGGGETNTYLIDGYEYEVTVIFISSVDGSEEAKFQVNDEITDVIAVNEDYILQDNSMIRLVDVLIEEAGEETEDMAEFCLSPPPEAELPYIEFGESYEQEFEELSLWSSGKVQFGIGKTGEGYECGFIDLLGNAIEFPCMQVEADALHMPHLFFEEGDYVTDADDYFIADNGGITRIFEVTNIDVDTDEFGLYEQATGEVHLIPYVEGEDTEFIIRDITYIVNVTEEAGEGKMYLVDIAYDDELGMALIRTQDATKVMIDKTTLGLLDDLRMFPKGAMEVEINKEADQDYTIRYTNKEGTVYNPQLLHITGDKVYFGDDDNKLYYKTGETIVKGDYFLAEKDDYTYFFELTDVDDIDGVTIRELGTGEIYTNLAEGTYTLGRVAVAFKNINEANASVTLAEITDDPDGKANIYTALSEAPPEPVYGVDMSVEPSSRGTDTVTPVTYTITLENTGSVTDTYGLMIEQPVGVTIEISPSLVEVEPGYTADIIMTASSPVPDTYEIIVRAFSQTKEEAMSQTAYLTLEVTGPYSQAFSFVEGYNLIALPVVPSDVAMRTLLAGILDKIEIIYGYDEGMTPPWLVFYPDETIPQNLVEFEPGKAYWIKMTEDAGITINGTLGVGIPPVVPSVQLTAGWNLIGVHGVVPTPQSLYFNNIEGKYTSLWHYNQQTKDLEKITLDPNGLLYPGEGYWLYMTEEGVIIP